MCSVSVSEGETRPNAPCPKAQQQHTSEAPQSQPSGGQCGGHAHLWDFVPAGLAAAGDGAVHDVIRNQEEGLELCVGGGWVGG